MIETILFDWGDTLMVDFPDELGKMCYISGYFCYENLGVGKESSSFFDLILHELNVSPGSVLMIGDSLDRDVLPSISAGIHGIWFNPLDRECPSGIRAIKHLSELVSIVDQFD
jgi:putative hydrolase of the HAD superfamily